MNSRIVSIVALALIFGISAAVGVNHVVRKFRESPSEIETVPVVVASVDIPRGATIAPRQLGTHDWPRKFLPPNSLTNVEEVSGRVAFNPIAKGEVLLEGMLAAKDSGRGLAALIPAGMRAFTIHTPHVASGVAGFVLPGNKVDVLLTMTGTSERTGGAVTTTLLQCVEILAVDQRLDAPTENKVDYRQLQSVTLLVTPDQAAKLDLGQNRGTLHLALRNPEDASTAKTNPAMLSELQFHQEKPIGDIVQVKTLVPKSPPTFVPPPLPPLEIRTLRGVSSGTVILEEYPGEALGRQDQGRH